MVLVEQSDPGHLKFAEFAGQQAWSPVKRQGIAHMGNVLIDLAKKCIQVFYFEEFSFGLFVFGNIQWQDANALLVWFDREVEPFVG
jgi:hypothetical protein